MGHQFSIGCATLLALTTAITGCGRSPATPVQTPTPAHSAETTGPAWLEDVTERLGLRFTHETNQRGEFFMPEMVGSGAALFDYDNDGRLDIYLLQNGGTNSPARNRLFHQEPDGHFKDVSAGSGLDIAGRGMGVAVGDVNNDGLPDVLVCEYGGVHLFLNSGNGKFVDVTKDAGLDDPHWANSAAFFDYDRDGWLDLVIVNYVDYVESIHCSGPSGKSDYCGPIGYLSTVTKLFHNLGKSQNAPATQIPSPRSRGSRVLETPLSFAAKGQGEGSSPINVSRSAAPIRFEDVTIKSGLTEATGPGLGVVCADFDGDGWPDIFITDDGKPNRLFVNQRNNTFKNEAVVRGIAYNSLGQPQANMGIAFGDTDGDGLFDIYVTHLTEETNILWKQGPPGIFQDATAVAGLTTLRWHATGFGATFADFNNDGAPDLAVVNGRVRRSIRYDFVAPLVPELGPFWSSYGECNQLFANDGTGKFHDISAANPAFTKNPRVGRGLAVGDIDGDGALDLLVTNCNGPAKLYRNVVPRSERGHWLMIRAIEPALGGRDAYGAKITIIVAGHRRVAWINPGYSYQTSNDPRAHFGLGPATQVDAVEVVWPDGSTESFPSTASDKVIVLRHGEGKTETHAANR